MATAPQYADKTFSAEPEQQLNSLLANEDLSGAQAELERLALEGLDSGEPVIMDAQAWERFRRDLARKASSAS